MEVLEKRKKTRKLKFGIRPILMMRNDGGLRIIYPDGRIHWCSVTWSEGFQHLSDNPENGYYACTRGSNQRESYLNAVAFDERNSAFEEDNSSAFLGYL